MTSTQVTEDEWLATRCQLGEPAAFRELVSEMERPLMYFAAKLLASERDAPDVVQEVWLQAFEKIKRLRDPFALRTWLYQITRAVAASRARRDIARERREVAAALDDVEPLNDAGEQPQWDPEDAAAVHVALDALSLQHREVLTLYFLEDLSIEAIAQVVSVPVGTVKSRLFHAKRGLRRILEESHGKD
jgi:RNA polymerase sigma-70 factor (ECF subfamily)